MQWTPREYRAFCRERRITLIEDGAQAFGVEIDGIVSGGAGRQSVFADADVATLSFHPAKVLGGIGDGGAVLCKSTRMAARVRSLANHGRTAGGQHEHVAAGWNSRMDAIQAAWLLRGLDVIDDVIDERRRLHALYSKLLTEGIIGVKPASAVYRSRPIEAHGNGYLITISTDMSFEDKRIPAEDIVKRLGRAEHRSAPDLPAHDRGHGQRSHRVRLSSE